MLGILPTDNVFFASVKRGFRLEVFSLTLVTTEKKVCNAFG